MKIEHNIQKFDLGKNGYLVATRDDNDEIQDFYLKAFLPDNTLVRQIRILYNIKYDYLRKQIWYLGDLIIDVLELGYGYGHLQWENSYGQPIFDSDFVNPYPDNFEPVKPDGCDLFRWEGYIIDVDLFENKISAKINLCIYKDLHEWLKPTMLNLITNISILDDFSSFILYGCELHKRKFLTMKLPMRLLQNMFYEIRRILPCFLDLKLDKLQFKILSKIPLKQTCNVKIARKQRIKNLRQYSKYIGVKIPYDSRFID